MFNKIDLLFEDEVAEKVDRIVKELAWEGEVFTMSAYSRQGTEELSIKLLDYIQALPVDDEQDGDKEVEFKWDNYHQGKDDSINENYDDSDDLDDDDFDEDDYDVEVIYQR